jgi:hypothetical protein
LNIEDLKDEIIKGCTGYYDLGVIKRLIDKPEVLETSEMLVPDKKLDYQGGVAIGPFVQYQLFLLFIIVLPIAAIINGLITKNHRGNIFIIILVVLYAAGYIILKNIKSLNREIKIDRSGIFIYEDEFQWENIYKTFILTVKNIKGPATSLLALVDNDCNIYNYQITNISCSKELLATIIEYYKVKNSNKKTN